MYLLTSIIWQKKYKGLSTLEQEATLQGRERTGNVGDYNLNLSFPTLMFFICYVVSLKLTANSRSNSNSLVEIQQTH